MDQLNAMRVFLRVIDEGSFAGAARALDLTRSAVTRAIADLETHLGSRLIHRTTRSLTLTDVGAEYLARIRPLLDDLDDADALATAATGQVRGRLRLTGSASFLSGSLAALLPAFQRQHEKLTIQLNVTPPLQEPDDRADITFLVQAPSQPDGDFVARLLAQTDVVLCASPAYLDAHGRPQGPEDLNDHQVLVPDVPFIQRSWQLRHGTAPGARTVTVDPQPARITSGSPEMLVGAARNGLGITGALSLDVAQDLRSGILERVLPDWHLATYTLYAAMPSRRHLPLRVRTFVDYLVEQFGGRAADPWLADLPSSHAVRAGVSASHAVTSRPSTGRAGTPSRPARGRRG